MKCLINRFLIIIIALLLVCITISCKASSDGDDEDENNSTQGRFTPPTWLTGKWEAVSPYSSKLEFTSDNIYDVDGNEEFVGYTDSITESGDYFLVKDNWRSLFVLVRLTEVDWLIDNGVASPALVELHKVSAFSN